MRKYLYIYKSEAMTNLQYAFDVILGFVGFVIIIFIFLNLWQYIYSDSNEIINGYSIEQMIWYVTLTEILWSIVKGRSLVKKIANDVRSGNIAYNLNKPYNYVEYALFGHLGSATIQFLFMIIIGLGLGYLFLHTFPSLTILEVLGVLLSCILSTIISVLFLIGIGLISFFIEDANPLYWVYSKLLLVMGTIFPIEFFPETIQKFLKFSPVYVINYGPAKLFVQFTNHEFVQVLFFQLIYIGIGFLICHLIYRKGVRRLNVNGG